MTPILRASDLGPLAPRRLATATAHALAYLFFYRKEPAAVVRGRISRLVRHPGHHRYGRPRLIKSALQQRTARQETASTITLPSDAVEKNLAVGGGAGVLQQ
jgi:hypothetical protein